MGRQRTPEELAYHREYMKKHRERNIEAQRKKEKDIREKLKSDPEKFAAYKAYLKTYREKNKERLAQYEANKYSENRKNPEFVETERKRSITYYYSLRDAAFEAYGGKKCACCGETIEQFLSIDHINNDGAKHRKEISSGAKSGKSSALYSWLKKNGYPPGFQVLCMNCNFGKARNGGICPHVPTVKEQ